jgi:hypothetical protein
VLVKVTKLTLASDSITLDGTTTSLRVCGWGGGGGGHGVDAPAPAAGFSICGMGGASGAYVEKVFVNAVGGATYNYTCGAGGTGGAAGDNDGKNGGDSTFVGPGPLTVTAKGGLGATDLAGGSASVVFNASGGTSTNGDINGIGLPGLPSIFMDNFTGCSGGGGTPALGVGIGGEPATFESSGVAGSGYSSGGSGGFADSGGADRAGGSGSNGFWYAIEYK